MHYILNISCKCHIVYCILCVFQLQLDVQQPLSAKFCLTFKKNEFDLSVHSVNIQKPPLKISKTESEFIKKLTGFDIESDWHLFKVDVVTPISYGKIRMIHPHGDIFLFKVNDDNDWKIVGCYLAQNNECQSIRTSDIPNHWQQLYYGALNNDPAILCLEIDGFSQCMEQLCILACCKELKVSLDWNNIPFCMHKLHVRVLHENIMLKEFAFLFDQQRKFSEFTHKQVTVYVNIRDNDATLLPYAVNDNFEPHENKYEEMMWWFRERLI